MNSKLLWAIALLCGALVVNPVLAKKPAWAGGGADKASGKAEKSAAKQDSPKLGKFFSERQREAVHRYYAQQFRTGNCPPGLAKKGNGCLPPGQAKKWALGSPLPRDEVYYDLPGSVYDALGAPPAGYEFVRVASDILMIAVGSGMVVDAISDLGGF